VNLVSRKALFLATGVPFVAIGSAAPYNRRPCPGKAFWLLQFSHSRRLLQ
jgi:hypothetical protein